MTETRSGPGLKHKDITSSSAFFALSAAAFVSGANLRLFDSLLPSVAEDFSVAPTAAAAVVTAFTLAYGLFQIVHGPLGDRMGKLRVVTAATLTAAAASLGSAFAPSLQALTVLRFISGIGAAGIVPLALAWIGDNSIYENRQAVIGRYVGFLLLGQVMGPAIGGLLSQFFSWREVFYGLTVVFALVGFFLLAEDRRSRPAAVPAAPRNVLRDYGSILRDPWTRTVLIAVFLEGALIFGAFAYVGVFLKTRFSLSFGLTGALMACYGIGGVLYSLLVRRLLSRFDQKKFVKSAGFVLLACFAALPWLPVWQAAVPVLTGVGFGFYLFHNTLQTKATEMAPQARGTAIAVFAFSLFTGQAVGVAVCTQAVRLSGYTPAFIAVGVLLLLLSRWFAGRLRDR
jgi:predicted MFS family arabinose efflux permease